VPGAVLQSDRLSQASGVQVQPCGQPRAAGSGQSFPPVCIVAAIRMTWVPNRRDHAADRTGRLPRAGVFRIVVFAQPGESDPSTPHSLQNALVPIVAVCCSKHGRPPRSPDTSAERIETHYVFWGIASRRRRCYGVVVTPGWRRRRRGHHVICAGPQQTKRSSVLSEEGHAGVWTVLFPPEPRSAGADWSACWPSTKPDLVSALPTAIIADFTNRSIRGGFETVIQRGIRNSRWRSTLPRPARFDRGSRPAVLDDKRSPKSFVYNAVPRRIATADWA